MTLLMRDNKMIELYDLATLQIRMNRLLFGYTMI